MTVVDDIKGKIANGQLTGKELPLVLDAIVVIVKNNDDTRELLSDMAEEGENVWINFKVTDMNETHCLEIKDGTIIHRPTACPNPTVTVTLDSTTGVNLISGKIDPVGAFSEKRVKLEGNLAKAMSLILVLNVVGDEFGIEIKT